jgi:hypothetical protein
MLGGRDQCRYPACAGYILLIGRHIEYGQKLPVLKFSLGLSSTLSIKRHSRAPQLSVGTRGERFLFGDVIWVIKQKAGRHITVGARACGRNLFSGSRMRIHRICTTGEPTRYQTAVPVEI